MKEKQIANVTPYLMGDHLILALSNKWIEVFGRIPNFVVVIEENYLIIKSPKIQKIRNRKFSLSEQRLEDSI